MRPPSLILSFPALALVGCTIHPTQIDVTELPLQDVVFKIQCEAQAAVRKLMSDRKMTPARERLTHINTLIKGQEDRLTPLRAMSKKLEAEQAMLIAQRRNIQRDVDAIKDIGPSLPVDELEKQVGKIGTASSAHNTATVQYFTKLWKNEDEKAPLEKRIAELQGQRDADRGIVALTRFYGNAAAFSFRFLITETNKATATALSYRFPIHLGTFTIGIASEDAKERESDRNAKFALKFKDLDDISCGASPPNKRGIRTAHYPIRGEIGLDEVFYQYVALLERKEGKFDKGESYTNQIKFTTTLSGSINPSFQLSPSGIDQLSGTFSAGASRKDIHSLLLSLTSPAPDAAPAVTRVEIVQNETLITRPLPPSGAP